MDFIIRHFPELASKTWEQIYLAGTATLIAILIGVPAGISVANKPKTKNLVLGAASIIQTIPSLALLVILLPFLGIGVKPALVALALYAILPIIRNTVTGLANVPDALREAADGLGFTSSQKLIRIELPLALPIIVAGIRTATVMSVGIATLATFIGAGGLGDFIYQGLSLANNQLILLGAVPAALLALVLDFLIALIEKRLTKRTSIKEKKRLTWVIFFICLGISVLGVRWIFNRDTPKQYSGTIIIGSKNFTEQIILGNILADMITAHTHLQVIKKFNLGGTLFCHHALVTGEIDLYPEYTGTAYMDILHKTNRETSTKIYHTVKQIYLDRYHLIWLKPFGFNNTNALAVTKAFYLRYGVTSISDLQRWAPNLTIGVVGDCLQRSDCYPAFQKKYHLIFKKVMLMSPPLLYLALENRKINVGEVFTTDGRIAAYGLVVLKDDRHVFPPYYAAPVVREQILKRYPEIEKALAPLAGKLTNKIMQQLNNEVDVEKKLPSQVAYQFLRKEGLI